MVFHVLIKTSLFLKRPGFNPHPDVFFLNKPGLFPCLRKVSGFRLTDWTLSTSDEKACMYVLYNKGLQQEVHGPQGLHWGTVGGPKRFWLNMHLVFFFNWLHIYWCMSVAPIFHPCFECFHIYVVLFCVFYKYALRMTLIYFTTNHYHPCVILCYNANLTF